MTWICMYCGRTADKCRCSRNQEIAAWLLVIFVVACIVAAVVAS